MKRTIKSLLLAAWIVFAAACSKDSADTEGPSEPQGPDDPQTELYTVTVRLNGIDQSIKPISKAVTTLPDTLRLRVTMNVFDQQGQFAYSDEILLNETGSEIPVQFQVKKGTYDLAFWADYVLYKNETIVSEAYNAADLRNISINNAMSSDAFSLVINDVVVDGDVTITSGTELSRAVAMLKIESDQTIPAGFAAIQYSLSQSVSSINLLTGESTIDSYGAFFSNTLTAGEPLSVSRYIFPCDPFTCSINLLDQNGTPVTNFEVENVETQKNVQTILKGDFFSENTSSGSLSLTLNQEWDADKVYVVEPILTAIPIADANFKTYLVANFDTNGDGEISTAEAKQVTTINVNTDNIYSLDGIEYFTNLTQLACKGTSEWDSNSNSFISKGSLTKIDLSKNTQLLVLDCGYNQLTQLNLSNNTLLTDLFCLYNQLTELNLSNNTQLLVLDCGYNQLTQLDLSNNTGLAYLYCDNNLFTELDLSNCSELTYLSCSGNQLTQLDLNNNSQLIGFSCENNQLTQLDLSNNSQLTNLNCAENQLTQLDLSNNTELTYLTCYDNQLTELDLSNNSQLTDLNCHSNSIIELNVINCTQLTDIYCGSNQLTELNVSSCTLLTKISCSRNQLNQLNLNSNSELISLICENNQLYQLDLGNNTQLTELWCSDNQLTQISLNNNTKLIDLQCYSNQLTELDLSSNTTLQNVSCYDNPLETIYVFEGYSFTLEKPETTQVVVK